MATINLDPGETITCTFTNIAQPGQINIIKDTVPDSGQDFGFTDNIAAPNAFMLDDDGDGMLSTTETFALVAAGVYTVTETAVSGFTTTLSFIDPSGGTTTADATATIGLAPGETVTCTYTNTQLGTINIIKDTVPDAAQDFSYTDNIAAPNAFTLDDDADGTLPTMQTFTNVTPGSYTVTDAAVASYSTTVACVDPDNGSTMAGTNVASIDLDAGETVTCTFTNTQLGTIEIIKDTVPDSGQDFSFTTSTGLTPNSFMLDDDADGTLPNTQAFTNVALGTFTVTEAAVAGYTTTVACVDPDGGSTMAGAKVATIDIDAGETITCTFTNTQLGTITIIKDTVPDAAQDFSFTDNIAAPNAFMLDDDADGTLPNTQTFTNVALGSYTVTETAVAAYTTTVACVDPDSGSTLAGTNVASIDVDAGETITCTFTNSSDDDGDGIANPIDGTVNGTFTDQSAVFSNDFTTQHLGGTTLGSISDRAGLQVSAQPSYRPRGCGSLLPALGAAPPWCRCVLRICLCCSPTAMTVHSCVALCKYR